MLDELLLKNRFDKTAGTYDRYALFVRQIAEELVSRFQYFKLKPEYIMDVGSGTGYVAQAFRDRYKKYSKIPIINVDYSENRLRWGRKYKRWFCREGYVCASGYQLPFKANSVDVLFSNLCLPFVNDINAVFLEWQRVLRPEGVCLFTTLGPDTLKELRQAFQAVDDKPHVHVFYDMHDVGDALMKAGFVDPVMDVVTQTQPYTGMAHLFKMLKGLGFANAMTQRSQQLFTPKQWQNLSAAYPEPCVATFEVIYGQAFGAQFLQNQFQNGEVRVPFEMLRNRKRT